MNNKLKGFLYASVGAATYGMNPLFTLPLYQEGMSVDSVLFYRYLLGAVILGVIMKIRRVPFALKKNEILPCIIGGLLIAVSSLFLFLSYHYMEAGVASTLLFVYPVMVAVIMAVLFKERLSFFALVSIVLTLSGIGLLYKTGDGKTLSMIGILFVMLSSLSYAIYIVGVKHSALKNLSAFKLSFYALLSGLSIFLVRLKFGMDLQMIPSGAAFANIMFLAAFPTVVSFLCTTLAIALIGSTPTAILGALEPVTAIFFGVLLFGELLTIRLIIGVLLILIGVSMIVAEKKTLPE